MKYVNTLAFKAATISPSVNRIRVILIWLIALLLGGISTAYAQLGWGPTKFEYQGNNTQLVSFCEVDPAFGFNMQWSGVGAGNPGTNPKLTVELPAGVSYRAGSISDVVAHPGGAATAAVVVVLLLRF